MTKEQIIDIARNELADDGVTYYGDADLNDSFDEGYKQICVFTGVLERVSELSIEDETVYYNFYETIPSYYRTFAVYSNVVDEWLSHKSTEYFKKLRYDWELARGTSRHYSVIDFQFTAFFPVPETATGTLEIFYKAVPDSIELDATPEMPEQHQPTITAFIVMDLLSQAEEYTKANINASQYFDRLNALRTYVNARSFPDRVNILREQFSGGSFYGS